MMKMKLRSETERERVTVLDYGLIRIIVIVVWFTGQNRWQRKLEVVTDVTYV